MRFLPLSMASNTTAALRPIVYVLKEEKGKSFEAIVKVPDCPSEFSVDTESRAEERQREANCGANIMVGC